MLYPLVCSHDSHALNVPLNVIMLLAAEPGIRMNSLSGPRTWAAMAR
jgi:hypothetical protein